MLYTQDAGGWVAATGKVDGACLFRVPGGQASAERVKDLVVGWEPTSEVWWTGDDVAVFGESPSVERIAERAGFDATVKVADLKRSLQLLGMCVSSRATLPVLSNVRLEGSPSGLLLEATDLESGVSIIIPGEVWGSYSTTIPFRQLKKMVDSKATEITISAYDDHIQVGGMVVPGLSADEFPIIPEATRPPLMPVNRWLPDMFDGVQYAISTDDTRTRLCGVQLLVEGKEVRLAATDSHRLNTVTHEIDPVETDANVITTRSLYQALRHVYGKGKKVQALPDAALWTSNDQAGFVYNGEISVSFVSRLFEGEFANYRRALPATTEVTVDVDRQKWLDALPCHKQIAGDDNRQVLLRIHQDHIALSSHSSKMGSAENEVPCQVAYDEKRNHEGYVFESREVALNVFYLEDMLKAHTAEVVQFHYAGCNQPTMATAQWSPLVCILMPMKIG
jgi:DNA polymerase III subunit beta